MLCFNTCFYHRDTSCRGPYTNEIMIGLQGREMALFHRKPYSAHCKVFLALTSFYCKAVSSRCGPTHTVMSNLPLRKRVITFQGY